MERGGGKRSWKEEVERGVGKRSRIFKQASSLARLILILILAVAIGGHFCVSTYDEMKIVPSSNR